eukprot:5736543-Pleurochrysis_carterae.AAC.1
MSRFSVARDWHCTWFCVDGVQAERSAGSVQSESYLAAVLQKESAECRVRDRRLVSVGFRGL